MRVFVTGATGFVGSAVVRELLGAGHAVLGLTRSDAGAAALASAGAEAHRGDLQDLESLRRGAAAADAVIHAGFVHDWANFAASCEIDRRAIEALGAALAGSQRPMLVTSGLATVAEGRLATENDDPLPASDAYPRASETTAEALARRGLRVSTVRLPQVHDTEKQGLVSFLIAVAREKGVAAYVGPGRNRWAAVHVRDTARLYRLALEKGEAGARYHVVGEEGVPLREIAEAIGREMNLPVRSIAPDEAAAHFGFLGAFVARDLTGASALTQQRMGWTPTGPGLLADLEQMTFPPVEAGRVGA